MEQLDDLIEKLNTDYNSAVSVLDKESSKWIFSNLTHEQIKMQYSSAENFFEHLFSLGYTELSLQEKRRNGYKAFKSEADPFDVTFSQATSLEKPKKTIQLNPEVEAEPKKVVKKKKSKKKKSKKGLMGLGMSEIFDLKLQAYDREELAKKLQESESQNKELRAKNEALNEEKLQRKYTKESNDSLNNMLLGVVKQAPIILKGLGFNVPVESSGLSIASEDDLQDENYSDVKKSFLDIVKTLDDDTITLLQVIYQKISENTENNVFSQELFELLQKHQMLV